MGALNWDPIIFTSDTGEVLPPPVLHFTHPTAQPLTVQVTWPIDMPQDDYTQEILQAINVLEAAGYTVDNLLSRYGQIAQVVRYTPDAEA
jgi:hypothetical protein